MGTRETQLPALPLANDPGFPEAVRQWLLVWGGTTGDKLDRKLSFRDLQRAGLARVTGGVVQLVATGGATSTTPGPIGPPGPPGAPGTEALDTTTPPLVTGLTVVPTVLTLTVVFDQPTYYRFGDPLKGTNHAYTEIWRAKQTDPENPPALGDAVLVGETSVSIFPDPLGPTGGETYFYWARNVSRAGIFGPYTETPASGTTTADPAMLLDLLNGAITATELAAALRADIELITAPDSTVGSVAYRVAQETAARIAAINAEVTARDTAISDSALALQAAVDGQIATVTDAAAAAQADATQALADISQEVLDRGAADTATLESAQLYADGVGVTAQAYTETYAYSKAEADSALAGQVTILRAEYQDADAVVAADSQAYVQTYAYSKAATDSAIAASATELTATIEAGDAASIAAAEAYVASFAYSKAAVDGAISAQGDTLRAEFTAADTDVVTTVQSWATDYTYSKAATDGAISSATSTLLAQFTGGYTGGDINAITSGLLYAERVARADADNSLAQQITLLSAGAGEQFDPFLIYYFDAGVEGWGGNGAPTATSGWLRPANHATNPYAESPDNLGVDGAKYPQVKLRIRKTGTPVWEGRIRYITVADTTWDDTKSVVDAEPTYDANGIAIMSIDMAGAWLTGTVRRIRIELSSDQAAGSYFEVDWFATGRPSPGASVAALLSEQTARAQADSSEVSARQALSTKLTGVADPSSLTLGTLSSGLLADERNARSTADTTEVSARQSLSTKVTGAADPASLTLGTLSSGLLFDERQARSSADSSEVTARQTLSTKVTGAADPSSLTLPTLSAGLLFDERVARSTADSSEVSARQALSTKVTGAADPSGLTLGTLSSGLLFDERVSRSTADSSEVTARQGLAATITGLADPTGKALADLSSGIIFEERQARASADSSAVTRLNNLEATVNNATTGVTATATALDVVEALVNNGTAGNNALVTKTDLLRAQITNTARALFFEAWEDPNALTRWGVGSNPSASIVAVADAVVGGKVLNIGDNAGNDQVNILHGDLIPFDPAVTYKMTARVRRLAGNGFFYCGYAGYLADGVTLCYVTGTTVGSHHYHCAQNVTPGAAWTEYVGYSKGTATTGTATAGTRANPGKFHQSVKYIRPFAILNYSAQTGQMQLDSIVVELSEATDIDAAVATETSARATENLAQAQQITTLQAVSTARNTIYRRPDTPPVPRPALRFPASTDYVQGPASSVWSIGSGDFSFETWVKFDASPSNSTLFELSLYTNGVLLRQNTPTTLFAYVVGAGAGQALAWAFTPALDKHYHVCITRSVGVVTLYVNGAQVQSPLAGAGSIAPTAGLRLGSSQHSTGQGLKGRLWGFRAYSRAISATEVGQHMAGTFTNETGLLAAIGLADGIGTVADDTSTNNLNGTLVGAPVWLTQNGHGLGDVWYDSDDSNKPYAWDGAAWQPSDDLRVATAVASLQIESLVRSQAVAPTHASANTYAKEAIVQSNGVLYRALQAVPAGVAINNTSYWAVTTANLYAQYTVKASINGRVSGFGLAADPTGSMFMVEVDRFAIGTPNDTRGPDDVQEQDFPFMFVTTPTTINGVEVQPGAYLRDAFLHNATITNAMIVRAGIDKLVVVDGDIFDLNAGKIRTGTLAADTKITVGGGITIDAAGSIVCDAPNEKVVLTSGNVTAYRKVGGIDYPYRALANVQDGTAENGVEVLIPGHFITQPRVIVAPSTLGVYKAAFSGQDQALVCSHGAITETSPGSMRWKFTPTATLVLADGSVGESPNARTPTSGEDSTNTWYSASFTAPANTQSVRPTVQVSSVRGTGTSPNYYFRQVVISIEYWNGSAWVAGSTLGTIQLGAQLNESAATQLAQYTFPSASNWQWRLKFVASDTDGTTFSTGASIFEFWGGGNTAPGAVNATVTGANLSKSYTLNQNGDRIDTAPLGAYSPPAGWSVYQVNYRATVTATATISSVTGTNTSTAGVDAIVNAGGAIVSNPALSIRRTTLGTQNGGPTNCQFATAGYDANAVKVRSFNLDPGDDQSSCSFLVSNLAADVYVYRPAANSVTPQNHAITNGYTYTLSAAQQLAEGTLIWIAVGA